MDVREVRIVVKDPISQQEKVVERVVSASTIEKIEELLSTQDIVPKDKVISAVQNLDIPAEAKAILVKLVDLTVTVGNRVLAIGKRILELTLYILREFPNAAAGLVIGAVIGFAFNFIPVLGSFISSIVTPLFAALGLAVGFWRDLQDRALKMRIEQEVISQFGALRDLK